MAQPTTMRLLMPTVRPLADSPLSSQAPSPVALSSTSRSPLKPTSPSKLIRAHSTSIPRADASLVVDAPSIARPNVDPAFDTGLAWLGLPLRFFVVHEEIQLEGFQLYAVEKWVVERTRPVVVLAVYTGDPSHKITVTCLSPAPYLLPEQATVEWEKAHHHLRRDGAKPKETQHGVIMATSLANFRSDYTIVRIPSGNFLSVRDHLYANINLLRMGCGGRSALTLEDSSDTTKDRFLTMYHLPDAHTIASNSSTLFKNLAARDWESPNTTDVAPDPSVAKSSAKSFAMPLFLSTVLEFVKLVQACLFIFGMYTNSTLNIGFPLDGLLCDITVDGIQQWVRDIGEPCLNVEPTERIVDPAIIASMLSLVVSVRNKLSALGYTNIPPVTKDPFLHPQSFLFAIAQYLSHASSSGSAFSTPKSGSPSPGFHIPHSSLHSPLGLSSRSSPSLVLSQTQKDDLQITNIYLTRAIIDSISTAYEKTRHNDSRKVHRVLLNKLDFTNAMSDGDGEANDEGNSPPIVANGNVDSAGGTGAQLLSGLGSLTSGLRLGAVGGGVHRPVVIMEPTTDLESFISQITGKKKDLKTRKHKGKNKSKDWNDSYDSRDLDMFSADQDQKIGGIAGSVRGLWSGRIAGVVKLRQRQLEVFRQEGKEPDKDKGLKPSGLRGTISDGDADERYGEGLQATDEDSDYGGGGTLGRPWSGRMHKRIDAWASRHRKRPGQSVDLSSSTKTGGGRPTLKGIGMPSMQSVYPATPDLHSADHIVYAGDTGSNSGQISSVDILQSPGPLSIRSGQMDHPSASELLPDYEKKVSAFNQKRPWNNRFPQSRVTSWSDPVSARSNGNKEDSSGVAGDGRHGSSRIATTSTFDDEDGSGSADDIAILNSLPQTNHIGRRSVKRHRSFDDSLAYRTQNILTPERMRIDVELCCQLHVMIRREQHLKNVLECLEGFTSSLAEVNTFLREDHNNNVAKLSETDRRSKVIADIEAERLKCELTRQEMEGLRYESTLFRVPDLWHTVSPQRQKVLSLRDKVFGMGSRQLAPGVKGAHGNFRRLQWRLDGDRKLVDHFGRTESEAEEEMDYGQAISAPSEDNNAIVVENPSVKPVWLLRFFTSWGARWGTQNRSDEATSKELQPDPSESAPSLSS